MCELHAKYVILGRCANVIITSVDQFPCPCSRVFKTQSGDRVCRGGGWDLNWVGRVVNYLNNLFRQFFVIYWVVSWHR